MDRAGDDDAGGRFSWVEETVMRHHLSLILLTSILSAGCAAAERQTRGTPGGSTTSTTSASPDADFARRCSEPKVVRCIGFDSPDEIAGFIDPGSAGLPTVDTSIRASGAGSLKFTVPSLSAPNSSGAFSTNFTPGSRNFVEAAYPVQFGQGEEFYVQWRQRFSPEFLRNKWAGGGGPKLIIIGEGDRPGEKAFSCTQLEVVVNNGYYAGFPQMYHSCGGKDRQYEGLPENFWTRRIRFKPNQWMTFQIHIKVGTWYLNDRKYHRDSWVELWVAEEGRPSKRAIGVRDYDLANSDNPAKAKYGKVWLTPFNTGKDPSVPAPEAYTWYDELVISRNRIPDPGAVPTDSNPTRGPFRDRRTGRNSAAARLR
jgi:hypothetical protein